MNHFVTHKVDAIGWIKNLFHRFLSYRMLRNVIRARRKQQKKILNNSEQNQIPAAVCETSRQSKERQKNQITDKFTDTRPKEIN